MRAPAAALVATERKACGAGRVFVAAATGLVVALHAETGVEVWRRELPRPTPAAWPHEFCANRVFLHYAEGAVYLAVAAPRDLTYSS